MIRKKLRKFLCNPFVIFSYLASKGLFNWMDDKTYIKMRYLASFGKRLDLNNPITFNEKLNWIKLYDRNPLYTILVDKIAVKEYVANLIGDEYIIPTLGVWDNPYDIDFDLLPNQFALKCNHNSGIGMCICSDKSKINIEEVKAGLRKGLNQDFYLPFREWPYKQVERKVFAEQFMVDESGVELKDYKFFCFDGEPQFMFVAKDRQKKDEEVKFDFFDMNFNHLPIVNGHPNSEPPYLKPSSFEKMKDVARKLSKGIPQVRIDLYDINGRIYFGEYTFFHFSGLVHFHPEEWDYKFGEWINLPK